MCPMEHRRHCVSGFRNGENRNQNETLDVCKWFKIKRVHRSEGYSNCCTQLTRLKHLLSELNNRFFINRILNNSETVTETTVFEDC